MKPENSKPKGQLTIYFGACPGVGKTSAMLTKALDEHHKSQSVMLANVQAHGRENIAALLAQFPSNNHKQTSDDEFIPLDIDYIVQQAPQYVLVESITHSNPHNSRHAKCWQDVQELLEEGIDVHCTLNIFELESLTDEIHSITGFQGYETVPDLLFDFAQIVFIDTPYQTILDRQSAGQIYLGKFGKQKHSQILFKEEVYITFRELALQKTICKAEADLLKHLSDTRDEKSFITEKILVCISPHLASYKLIRKAKQEAAKLNSEWTVIYVQNESHYRLNIEEKEAIERTFHLAQQLGAKIRTLHESNAVKAILHYAKLNHFTRIFIGKPAKPRWQRLFLGSLVSNLIEKAHSLDICVITEDKPIMPRKRSVLPRFLPWREFLNATLIVGFCTAFGLPLANLLHPENIMMIYLVGVVIIAALFERSTAVFGAILSAICYSIFFTSAYYRIDSEGYHLYDLLTIGVLLLIALVISTLTSSLRMQTIFARKREIYTADLYEFNKKLMTTNGKMKFSKVISEHFNHTFDCETVVWLPNHENKLEACNQDVIPSEYIEHDVADWAYHHQQQAGLGTETLGLAKGFYLPFISGGVCLGVAALFPNHAERVFRSEELAMLKALAIQAALALERIRNAQIVRN